jgi:hypothetical protein
MILLIGNNRKNGADKEKKQSANQCAALATTFAKTHFALFFFTSL